MAVYLAVALGGSLGAVCRFWIMSFIGRLEPDTFPWSTLSVNLLGAMLLGVLIEVSALVWSPSAEVRAFLVVGFLGALTTFSTFTLDIVNLWERGYWWYSLSYIFLSCAGCLLIFGLSMRGARLLLISAG